MSEQVVPSAVAQRISVTFVTEDIVTPAEILTRLRAQFGDEGSSRTQVNDWNNSFKECRTEVENMRRIYLLQGKLWSAFLGFSMRPIHRFSDRTRNYQRILLFEVS
jgi:hypothetical protein